MDPGTVVGIIGGSFTAAMGLVFWLVRWIVKTLRTNYDERNAETRAHNAEVVAVLKTQIETGKTFADGFRAMEAGQEATRRLVEAMTTRVRDAA